MRTFGKPPIPFGDLKQVLKSPEEVTDIVDTRIGDCISNILNGGDVYKDLAVLIRQSLRTEIEQRRKEGQNIFDDVANFQISSNLFPINFNFDEFGLEMLKETPSYRTVFAKPWNPEWIQNPLSKKFVDSYISSLENRKIEHSVSVDPFFKEQGNIDKYYSPAQREAVRACVFSDPGSTLLINLPTGSGKTLAILAPVLSAPEGTTSLIVVPTVSLAIDQENRYKELTQTKYKVAYHSGLTDDEKKDFTKRIYNGNQKVIFTNPETVLKSLAGPLTKVAENGQFRLFAIDEAHIVASWGESFRPDFQALAGFRNHLMRTVQDSDSYEPFKTILATATVTENTFSVLKSLFGNPGPFLQVASPAVRAEPAFWNVINLQPQERMEYLLEAVRYLPRPLIIYTTLRQKNEAGTLRPSDIAKELKLNGFKRFSLVDGGMDGEGREETLEAFKGSSSKAPEIDMVVATSAFGLGIDVPDVRSVIHACIPESLDRFYQEVGRGGRDGSSSISLLLATKEDHNTAKGMSDKREIGKEKAMDRWKKMHANRKETKEEGLFRINSRSIPARLEMDTNANQKWNLTTLGILARAGVISWDYTRDDNSDTAHKGDIAIRILKTGWDDPSFWKDTVEPERIKTQNRVSAELDNVMSILGGNECAGRVIAQSYELKENSGYECKCVIRCASCHYCRKNNIKVGLAPEIAPSSFVSTNPTHPLKKLAFRGMNVLSPRIICEFDGDFFDQRRRERRRNLDNIISKMNIKLVVSSNESRDIIFEDIKNISQKVMWEKVEQFEYVAVPKVETLIFIDDDSTHLLDIDEEGFPMVVIMGAKNLHHSDRSLSDQESCYTYNNLKITLERL